MNRNLAAAVLCAAAIAAACALILLRMRKKLREANGRIEQLETALMKDRLTGMRSAYAYADLFQEMNGDLPLPEDLTVFMIDANEMKYTNDNIGHQAGDELVAGMAGCVLEAVGDRGECYRIGGDEFFVLTYGTPADAEALSEAMKRNASAWKGEKCRSGSISLGYARAGDYPGTSFEKLVHAADVKMYEQKALYYQNTGRDRRRR